MMGLVFLIQRGKPAEKLKQQTALPLFRLQRNLLLDICRRQGGCVSEKYQIFWSLPQKVAPVIEMEVLTVAGLDLGKGPGMDNF